MTKEFVSSGWGNTDAVNYVSCPRCKVKPGEDCITPKGRRVFSPHVERLIELRKQYPESTKACRIKNEIRFY